MVVQDVMARSPSSDATNKDESRGRSRSSSNEQNNIHDAGDPRRLSKQLSRQSTRRSGRRTARWWKIRFFKGMIDDVKRRAPYYMSDWTDAWDYRVVPATVYMYFAKYVISKELFHLSSPSIDPSSYT